MFIFAVMIDRNLLFSCSHDIHNTDILFINTLIFNQYLSKHLHGIIEVYFPCLSE